MWGSISKRVSRNRSRFYMSVSSYISPVSRKDLFSSHIRARFNLGFNFSNYGKKLCRSDQQIYSFPRPLRRYAAVSTSTAHMCAVLLPPLSASPKQKHGRTGPRTESPGCTGCTEVQMS
ncbi:pre-coat protein [Sunn hemp leaf distortion virus [India:Barrackpore2:2008]]|nr:pre-coat protein [Sunn hemp leaf distortion virus [India:Barrackpore2:2008]]ACS92549.1 pre-coat protein [Sunn hemp leaf distortion virus [India:Barrackpore3:2008]]